MSRAGHPPWCSYGRCDASGLGGAHESAPTAVPSAVASDVSFTVALVAPSGGRTVVRLRVVDPDAAYTFDVPIVAALSLAQTVRRYAAIGSRR